MALKFIEVLGAKLMDNWLRNAFDMKAAAAPTLERANQLVMEDFVKEITTYPPMTRGNSSPAPYWKRGVGLVRGGGVVDPVSQRLGGGVGFLRSWKRESQQVRFGAFGKISTTVSYAPWVVGTETQSAIHRKNKWQSVADVLLKLGMGGVELIANVGARRGAIAHYADARQKLIAMLRRPVVK